jgi:hypothetical protein
MSRGHANPQRFLDDRFRSGPAPSIAKEYSYEPSIIDETSETAWETATLNPEHEELWQKKAEERGARKKRQDAFKAPIYETYLKHATEKDQDMLEKWTETLNILLTFVCTCF